MANDNDVAGVLAAGVGPVTKDGTAGTAAVVGGAVGAVLLSCAGAEATGGSGEVATELGITLPLSSVPACAVGGGALADPERRVKETTTTIAATTNIAPPPTATKIHTGFGNVRLPTIRLDESRCDESGEVNGFDDGELTSSKSPANELLPGTEIGLPHRHRTCFPASSSRT